MNSPSKIDFFSQKIENTMGIHYIEFLNVMNSPGKIDFFVRKNQFY